MIGCLTETTTCVVAKPLVLPYGDRKMTENVITMHKFGRSIESLS